MHESHERLRANTPGHLTASSTSSSTTWMHGFCC